MRRRREEERDETQSHLPRRFRGACGGARAAADVQVTAQLHHLAQVNLHLFACAGPQRPCDAQTRALCTSAAPAGTRRGRPVHPLRRPPIQKRSQTADRICLYISRSSSGGEVGLRRGPRDHPLARPGARLLEAVDHSDTTNQSGSGSAVRVQKAAPRRTRGQSDVSVAGAVAEVTALLVGP
jgi:hypothetical protein